MTLQDRLVRRALYVGARVCEAVDLVCYRLESAFRDAAYCVRETGEDLIREMRRLEDYADVDEQDRL